MGGVFFIFFPAPNKFPHFLRRGGGHPTKFFSLPQKSGCRSLCPREVGKLPLGISDPYIPNPPTPSSPSFLSHPPGLRSVLVQTRAAVTENKAISHTITFCPFPDADRCGGQRPELGAIQGPCQDPAGRRQYWQ